MDRRQFLLREEKACRVKVLHLRGSLWSSYYNFYYQKRNYQKNTSADRFWDRFIFRPDHNPIFLSDQAYLWSKTWVKRCAQRLIPTHKSRGNIVVYSNFFLFFAGLGAFQAASNRQLGHNSAHVGKIIYFSANRGCDLRMFHVQFAPCFLN